MPKAKSPLFKEIKGSFVNMDVRMHKRGFIELSSLRIPSDPNTEAQQAVRYRYGRAVGGWRALSEAEKQEYNLRAVPMRISGWNLYMKEYEVPPQYENFLEWIEQDGLGRLSQTEERSTWTGMLRTDNYIFLWKDYGVNHFDDFEHVLDLKVESIQYTETAYNRCCPYLMCNALNDYVGLLNANEETLAIVLRTWQDSSHYVISLIWDKGESADRSSSSSMDIGTVYYLTIKRVGLNITCKIYSDSKRTSLIETLEIDMTIDDNFRYLMVPASLDYPSGNTQSTGYVEKLGLL